MKWKMILGASIECIGMLSIPILACIECTTPLWYVIAWVAAIVMLIVGSAIAHADE